MAVMEKVYHSDPGHGWLAVKLSDLKMLGIESKITSFSYVKGKTVYLEEDCDMSTFIHAATEKGIEVKVKQSSQRDRSPIRYFKSYSPEAV
jgi:predicted acyltransferase (DUF342 family)